MPQVNLVSPILRESNISYLGESKATVRENNANIWLLSVAIRL